MIPIQMRNFQSSITQAGHDVVKYIFITSCSFPLWLLLPASNPPIVASWLPSISVSFLEWGVLPSNASTTLFLKRSIRRANVTYRWLLTSGINKTSTFRMNSERIFEECALVMEKLANQILKALMLIMLILCELILQIILNKPTGHFSIWAATCPCFLYRTSACW